MADMNAALQRVLIIDAEPSLRQLLRKHFELAGFSVEDVGDGHAGLERLRAAAYDVVILDLSLPRVDGLTLCRTLRAEGPNTETVVVIVSARSAESDKVVALASGADDYVTKPFGVRELLARVDAITRRVRRADRQPLRPPAVTAVRLDASRREAIVRGQRVELTRQEFDVLYQLAARPGTVLTRAALLQHVWSDEGHASERTVDVAISRLRRKIEPDPQDPAFIKTIRNEGYFFAAPVALMHESVV
jgi:DNA-binding response OmpR family regulator